MCLNPSQTTTLWQWDSFHRPATKGSHSQGSWLGPNQQAGAHCSRLLMICWAPGKNMGIVTSMWAYTHDTKQLINLNLKHPMWAYTHDTKQLINLNLKHPSQVVSLSLATVTVRNVSCKSGSSGVQQISTTVTLYPLLVTHIIPHINKWIQHILYPMHSCWYLLIENLHWYMNFKHSILSTISKKTRQYQVAMTLEFEYYKQYQRCFLQYQRQNLDIEDAQTREDNKE